MSYFEATQKAIIDASGLAPAVYKVRVYDIVTDQPTDGPCDGKIGTGGKLLISPNPAIESIDEKLFGKSIYR
jgi:hypothetical protein